MMGKPLVQLASELAARGSLKAAGMLANVLAINRNKGAFAFRLMFYSLLGSRMII
jgi:hypothetical protein